MVFDFGVALWMADRMGGWPWWGQLLGPRCTLSSVDIAPPPPPPRSSPPPSGFNVFLTLRPNIQVIHQGQVRPYTGRDGRNNKLSWSRWHLPTKRLQTCVKNTGQIVRRWLQMFFALCKCEQITVEWTTEHLFLSSGLVELLEKKTKSLMKYLQMSPSFNRFAFVVRKDKSWVDRKGKDGNKGVKMA